MEHTAYLPSKAVWLGQFQGHLITVGGVSRTKGTSDEVYRHKPKSRKWEVYLQPMPTARYYMSVITTMLAIVTCGGKDSHNEYCATVEVYTADADQWFTADSLFFVVRMLQLEQFL